MTELILLARLLLAGVFVVSAVAKLKDRPGTRTAVRDFGVPARLVQLVAASLPVLELACAALLLSADPGATTGAAAAAALLAVFTLAIVANLARGRQVECHCFGQLSKGRTGWATVVRNTALLLLAVLPLLRAGELPAVTSSLADYSGAQLAVGALLAALMAAVAVLAWMHHSLLTRYGGVLLRLEAVEERLGLAAPPSLDVPSFVLPDLDGQPVALSDVLGRGRPALVVFISPGCGLCTELLPDLERWQAEQSPLEVLVLSTGTAEANRDKVGAGSSLQVLLQDDEEVGAALGLQGTPAAFLVGVDGRTAGAPAYGVEPVRQLHLRMSGALSDDDHRQPQPLQIGPRPASPGDSLPADVQLRDELGRAVDLQTDDETVLLFWRTDCGFCAQIAQDVARLEQDRPVLLVSGSSVEDVRATGLESPVVTDEGQVLWQWLQVPGTPSAVRVRGGALTSSVGVGGPEVLRLLSAERVHSA